MMAIDLYLVYLDNCALGMSRSDKLVKLKYERKKILEIINELDSMFENDPKVSDTMNRSIYVIIKRDIRDSIASKEHSEAKVNECKSQLREIVDIIDTRMHDLCA